MFLMKETQNPDVPELPPWSLSAKVLRKKRKISGNNAVPHANTCAIAQPFNGQLESAAGRQPQRSGVKEGKPFDKAQAPSEAEGEAKGSRG